jgi:flagellar protein FliT
MSVVNQIYTVTSTLHDLITDETFRHDNRDEVIEKIEQLLSKRQELLPHLEGPFSEEEKVLGRRIVELNKVIDEKLPLFKAEIQKDMNKVKKQKSSNEIYTNPYKNVSFDGMFFDKKK